MKQLYVASTLVEADLIVARLAAAGIAAQIPDRHTAAMAPHLITVLGGVRIMVADEDLAAAQKIISRPPLTVVDS